MKRMFYLLPGFLLLATSCATPDYVRYTPPPPPEPEERERLDTDLKIGLALGGGGANGLAHVIVFEAFDELGLKPHRISGTSIGAIMGALYASGRSAEEIRALVNTLVTRETDTWRELLQDRRILGWIRFLDPEFGEGGLVSAEAFLSYLQDAVGAVTFEELEIPLYVVTADLWTREQVVFNSGELYPALQAGMAIPGLFTPARINDRILVDGGVVNPVPYDILLDDCDLVVAVNVIGHSIPDDHLSFLDALFTSIRIMQTSILREKMNRVQPHIFIDTQITSVRMLEFKKIDQIYRQALPSKARLKEQLREHFHTAESTPPRLTGEWSDPPAPREGH